MRSLASALLLGCTLLLSLNGTAQPSASLTLLWETDALLTTIESAIYDPESGFIYTTNIEGHFMDKDGVGSISKVSMAGEIVERDWVAGLNAPTGTAIHNGRLYVTDIDAIVVVDIAAGEVEARHAIDGAVALNDIAVDAEGVIYASDTGGNAIYRLRAGQVDAMATDIDTPNGLLPQGDDLLITRWTPQTVDRLSLETQELSPIATGIAGPDGLEAVGDGTYLASGFNGLVYHVHADSTKRLLLDTTAEGARAADIDYVPGKRLLLVPTMQHNTLRAYRLAR
ncbi:MAG: ATP/GTP-binding protein [Bacteroidota bacterium]